MPHARGKAPQVYAPVSESQAVFAQHTAALMLTLIFVSAILTRKKTFAGNLVFLSSDNNRVFTCCIMSSMSQNHPF